MDEKESLIEVVTLHIRKKQVVRIGILFGMLLCSAISIMINPAAFQVDKNAEVGMFQIISLLRGELGNVEMAHVLAFGCMAVLYYRELFLKETSFCTTAFIVGGILSIFLMIGTSLSVNNNFDFLFGGMCQYLIAFAVFLGFWCILYVLLKLFYTKIDQIMYKAYCYEGILKWIDDHFVFLCIGIMFLCWLVLGIAFFPGSVPHDGRNQLNMVFGFAPWKIHHPYFSTIILGAIYGLGYKLFGYIGGCIFYVLFQSALGSVVFSLICDYIRIKTRNIVPALVCLVYFSVTPMWWTYMQTIAKDTIYVIVYAFFVLEYVKVFLNDCKKQDLWWLVFSAIGVCVLRNGAHYIVLPSLLVLIVVAFNWRKVVTVVFAVVLVMNFGLNTVLMNELGLTSVNQVEPFSIPLQQVARCVTLHEDEFTEEERNIIDCVIEYDGIPERYNPELSDPIKNKYKNTTQEQWENFWKLWLDKFMKYPDVYITATMNHVYGYIDPFYFYSGMGAYQLYSQGALSDLDAEMDYSVYVFGPFLRNSFSDATYIWQKVPILSFVVNPAFYTWLGIIMIGALIRKKQYVKVLIFTIPLINILICFASPVNGFVRYTLPIMASIPIFMVIAISSYLDIPLYNIK